MANSGSVQEDQRDQDHGKLVLATKDSGDHAGDSDT
jgi:hypothetical protein